MVPLIMIQELKKLIQKGDGYILIDVREQEELSYGMIPTAKHIPLGEFEEALDLDVKTFKQKYYFSKPAKEKTLILYCRTGNRSMLATQIALNKGYSAKNYYGSIWEWSTIDSSVKRY